MHGKANNKISYRDGSIIKYFSPPKKVENFWRELLFYSFCKRNSLVQTPKLLSYSIDHHQIEIENIVGINARAYSQQLLQSTANFIKHLNSPITRAYSNFLPNAAEAILRPEDLGGHLRTRRSQVAHNKKFYPLKLNHQIDKIILALSIEKFQTGPLLVNPSDLGLHNTIIRKHAPVFIDFEYAGIDSYIKLLLDFCLHPANFHTHEDIDKIHKLFCGALKIEVFEIPSHIIKAFYIWWVLRLLNSMSNESILNRTSDGVLKQEDVPSYIEGRYEQFEKFWKMAQRI